MTARKIETIKALEIIKSLPTGLIEEFYNSGKFKIKKHKKGSIIHIEGDVCDKIEIILSGNIVIDSLDEAGNLLTVTDFFKDDILGGNLIFASDSHYPMTISALKDSELLQIDKSTLIELFEISQEFLITFLRLISDNTSILSKKVKHGINKTIREKLLIFLSRQQKAQMSNEITLNISKKKMAEKMGVQRTSLSRELTKMKEEGSIDYDRDKIYIINLDKARNKYNEDR